MVSVFSCVFTAVSGFCGSVVCVGGVFVVLLWRCFFFAGADFVVVVSLGPGLQHLTSIHLLWPNCCVHVSICLDLVGWCHFHVGKQKDELL